MNGIGRLQVDRILLDRVEEDAIEELNLFQKVANQVYVLYFTDYENAGVQAVIKVSGHGAELKFCPLDEFVL